jgi:hypothetical protein
VPEPNWSDRRHLNAVPVADLAQDASRTPAATTPSGKSWLTTAPAPTTVGPDPDARTDRNAAAEPNVVSDPDGRCVLPADTARLGIDWMRRQRHAGIEMHGDRKRAAAWRSGHHRRFWRQAAPERTRSAASSSLVRPSAGATGTVGSAPIGDTHGRSVGRWRRSKSGPPRGVRGGRRGASSAVLITSQSMASSSWVASSRISPPVALKTSRSILATAAGGATAALAASVRCNRSSPNRVPSGRRASTMPSE